MITKTRKEAEKLTSKYPLSLSRFSASDCSQTHTHTYTNKRCFYACLLINLFFFRDKVVESKTSSYIYIKNCFLCSLVYIAPIFTRNQKIVFTCLNPSSLHFSSCHCWVVRFCHSNYFEQLKCCGKWRQSKLPGNKKVIRKKATFLPPEGDHPLGQSYRYWI